MPDSLARALRTGAQLGIVEALIQLLVAFNVPISPGQHTALLGFITPVVTLAICALEDNPATRLPALLKGSPPAKNPVGPEPEVT